MKYNKERRIILEEILAKAGKCERCPRKDILTIDHIIPMNILLMMGFKADDTFDLENFAVLCRPCNQLKSFALDFGDPRTKKLLIKYLDRL